MKKKKRGNLVMGITSRVVMLVAAGLLLTSYLSIFVTPSPAWFMSLFGLLFIPFALLNFFLLIWALRRKSGSCWIPLLALLPAFIFVGRYFQFSSGGKEKNEHTVKIVTYNVGNFCQGRMHTPNDLPPFSAAIDSVVNFLKSLDPDIVCMQEVFFSGEYDIASILKRVFPDFEAGYYMYPSDEGSHGNVTLSRFPIVEKGHFDFEQSANLAIYTDVRIGASKLRIYNCHFESYNISLTRLAKSVGRDNTIVREAEHKMKESISKRPRQVDQVMEDIEACPIEALVAGDFNDTPMSYTYHRLMKNRDDSFVEAGKGFGATYSVLWPFIRIDYILYPSRFDAVSSRVVRKKFSDHYPVIAEINVQ
jgi:endonuclease/exonuclease/phosphatase family metal-dependent hydrolase